MCIIVNSQLRTVCGFPRCCVSYVLYPVTFAWQCKQPSQNTRQFSYKYAPSAKLWLLHMYVCATGLSRCQVMKSLAAAQSHLPSSSWYRQTTAITTAINVAAGVASGFCQKASTPTCGGYQGWWSCRLRPSQWLRYAPHCHAISCQHTWQCAGAIITRTSNQLFCLHLALLVTLQSAAMHISERPQVLLVTVGTRILDCAVTCFPYPNQVL